MSTSPIYYAKWCVSFALARKLFGVESTDCKWRPSSQPGYPTVGPTVVARGVASLGGPPVPHRQDRRKMLDGKAELPRA